MVAGVDLGVGAERVKSWACIWVEFDSPGTLPRVVPESENNSYCKHSQAFMAMLHRFSPAIYHGILPDVDIMPRIPSVCMVMAVAFSVGNGTPMAAKETHPQSFESDYGSRMSWASSIIPVCAVFVAECSWLVLYKFIFIMWCQSWYLGAINFHYYYVLLSYGFTGRTWWIIHAIIMLSCMFYIMLCMLRLLFIVQYLLSLFITSWTWVIIGHSLIPVHVGQN